MVRMRGEFRTNWGKCVNFRNNGQTIIMKKTLL